MKGKQHNLTMNLFYYRHNQNSAAPEIRFQKIAFCELTSKDVVRHPLVQKIVKAYETYEAKQRKRSEKTK